MTEDIQSWDSWIQELRDRAADVEFIGDIAAARCSPMGLEVLKDFTEEELTVFREHNAEEGEVLYEIMNSDTYKNALRKALNE